MTEPLTPEQKHVLGTVLNFIHSATVYLGSVAPIADEVDKRMLEGLLELGEMCMRRLPGYFPERMTEAACPPGGGPLGG